MKKNDTKRYIQLLTFIVKFFRRSIDFQPFSSAFYGNQEPSPYFLNNIRKKPNCFSYVAKRINFEKNSPVKKSLNTVEKTRYFRNRFTQELELKYREKTLIVFFGNLELSEY